MKRLALASLTIFACLFRCRYVFGRRKGPQNALSPRAETVLPVERRAGAEEI